MPDALGEDQRLDLQHLLFKLALGGNYRSPISQPQAILDVACGTAIWGRELAMQFPAAEVVGFDITHRFIEASLTRSDAGQPPSNFRFLAANALERFPFADERFDLTYVRAASSFTPIARLPEVIAEMVRVTKVGGYVEVVEAGWPTSPSPAASLLLEIVASAAAGQGLSAGVDFSIGACLRQGGLQEVEEWHSIGGTGPSGSLQHRLLVADLLMGFELISPIVLASGAFSEDDYQETLLQALDELPEMGASLPIVGAYGRRTQAT